MKLIKNKNIDHLQWQISEQLDQPGKLIFPYEIYQQKKSALLSRSDPTGLLINGDISLELITEAINKLPLIALQISNFSDGRCFSHAQLLRGKYQYKGDLLATGDILRDQLEHLHRCGFNLIVLEEGQFQSDVLNAFNELTIPYQPSSDQQATILERRHSG